ncbi:prolyl oligopeptidase family serine peptidase [Fulvivirgaceae bacterium BMA10]|uniref:Prolyl oligopeptidase family serine peptidase n=1 Tax=Splendidivirga corallicola TaxID=3051826 RepID=A0ABT8KPI5_9BACT|nr:prolyl oligopeptidase family serine peptidase [Fulvivirgaceae bacterium BMA10]
MPKTLQFILILVFFSNLVLAQNAHKKSLDHDVYDHWTNISENAISNDGKWIIYALTPQKGEATFKIYSASKNSHKSIPRGSNGIISHDSRFVIFKIAPQLDTLQNLRRLKKKEDELPKDSLGIFNLATSNLTKVPRVKSFKVPKKADGWLAYQLEKEPAQKKDTTNKSNDQEKNKAKKEEKVDNKKKKKKNGSTLVVRNLLNSEEKKFEFVTAYNFTENGKKLILASEGNDSTFMSGVYVYHLNNGTLKPLLRSEGKFKEPIWDEAGQQASFLADLDTSKAKIRYFNLYYWNENLDSAKLVADTTKSIVPKNWLVNHHTQPSFSKNGKHLFFDLAPKPVLPDTTLLPEEIVDVEIWSWKDQKLYPQQKVELEDEKKRGYAALLETSDFSLTLLGTEEVAQIILGDEGNASVALGVSERPYHKLISWEGFPLYKDIYVVDAKTGEKNLVKKKVKANVNISPKAKYLYWYDVVDTAWYTYSISKQEIHRISNNTNVKFYNELFDTPDFPRPYGIAGWTKDDDAVLVYDRYDIWQFDPLGEKPPTRLTNGRAQQIQFRYIQLDPEKKNIDPKEPLLLHAFNEENKQEGFYSYSLTSRKSPAKLLMDDFRFNFISKSKSSDDIIFTKESFREFPDIHLSNLKFKATKKVSGANPQQNNYYWGSAELMKWNSLDGVPLDGLLFKPDNFDPTRQYPLMVYFYERNSNNLHDHRAPQPYRSIINITFYASRGYVVFVPDIPYRTGYPGESAKNAILPGVTALIDKGFIDEKRIGVQGHSWGGYQIAYLVTKTNIFKAAEAGAPVSNMTSAYGGIRWGTGLSRMFQYERTQSRIGGTLWEYPMRYIENSPLFSADKIHTPILMMHNDHDTAVPWYQGIEFFVALRRLNKPVWLINYVEEPHNLTKYENKKDWAIRMQQFFDHYLKDAPQPVWMREGLPAIEQGINQGYELTSEE